MYGDNLGISYTRPSCLQFVDELFLVVSRIVCKFAIYRRKQATFTQFVVCHPVLVCGYG